jgi:predicted nuclease of restriction endonuclease-like (RecB) superfamily
MGQGSHLITSYLYSNVSTGFARVSSAKYLENAPFFNTYSADLILSPLVRELPWTHNLIILSQCKHPEEREFYLRMAARERWSKRKLERKFNTALFERVVLTCPVARNLHENSHLPL